MLACHAAASAAGGGRDRRRDVTSRDELKATCQSGEGIAALQNVADTQRSIRFALWSAAILSPLSRGVAPFRSRGIARQPSQQLTFPVLDCSSSSILEQCEPPQ